MSGLRQWRDKFGCAGRGVVAAVREGSSFVVHLAAAVAVIVLSVLLNVSAVELAVLLICIVAVLAVETFNSALETLARAVTSEHNEHVGKSLDMAAGAVLLMSTGAAAAGLAILVPRLKALWSEP